MCDADGTAVRHACVSVFDATNWIPGGAGPITPVLQTIINATIDAQGRVTKSFPSTLLVGQGGVMEVFMASVPPPSVSAFDLTQGRMYFQSESGLEGFGQQVNLP